MHVGRRQQIVEHARRELLAEFDAPLVKGIHPPHHTLDEGAMLIERNQRTQGEGVKAVEQHHVARPIARKHAVRDERLDACFVHAGRAHFGVDLVGGWLSPIPAALIPDVPVLSTVLGDGWWWLLAKVFFFASCFIWFRASFPRYRYDQIMRLGWKVFIPITIVWIFVTALLVFFGILQAGQ